MIAANIVGETGSGFNADTNEMRLFYADGSSEELPRLNKFTIANIIIDRVVAIIKQHSRDHSNNGHNT
jgi:phosphopantothenoylcysteine decarboxylase / phosphopantothenate---cysteine ligase